MSPECNRKGEAEGDLTPEEEVGEEMTKARGCKDRLLAVGSENMGRSWKRQEMNSPLELPAKTLILAP